MHHGLGHAIVVMDMHHGHGRAAWTWIYSMDLEMQYRNRHAARTLTSRKYTDMDIQHGQ
jgi:hypothetical protein